MRPVTGFPGIHYVYTHKSVIPTIVMNYVVTTINCAYTQIPVNRDTNNRYVYNNNDNNNKPATGFLGAKKY